MVCNTYSMSNRRTARLFTHAVFAVGQQRMAALTLALKEVMARGVAADGVYNQ